MNMTYSLNQKMGAHVREIDLGRAVAVRKQKSIVIAQVMSQVCGASQVPTLESAFGQRKLA